MRTTRIRTTALAAAATAVLALGLTACGGSDSDSGSGKGTNVDVGKSAGKTAGAEGSEKSGGDESTDAKSSSGQGTSGGGSGSGGSGADKASADSAVGEPCKGDELSISVLHRFPAEQGEHLLITAKNADSKPCWVTSYPSVMLGDTSKVLSLSSKDDSSGTTKVTITPGGEVYSAVALFVDGDKTNTSTELSIALRDQSGDTGPGHENGAVDSKGGESEFTWDGADVTNWNTEKPYDF
ncbi:DUF4232 domain-containing protein [Streptomyces sp. NBC_01304]|uniref:DUF4232 domain-containing protein n=1 Tax=Streptomyces sp. NBC_01304 TaxID=2903818 RepID=UPI002E13DC2A|nr:DUF4232 domain-containing protein [Streptomyces sp. NBC_01304]